MENLTEKKLYSSLFSSDHLLYPYFNQIKPLSTTLFFHSLHQKLQFPEEKFDILNLAQEKWALLKASQRPYIFLPSNQCLLDCLDELIQNPELPIPPNIIALMLVHKMISRAQKGEYYDVLFADSTSALDRLVSGLDQFVKDEINLQVLMCGINNYWHSSGVHILGHQGSLHVIFYDSSNDHKLEKSNFNYLMAALSTQHNVVVYRPPFEYFQKARRGCGIFAINFLSDSNRIAKDSLLRQMQLFRCDNNGTLNSATISLSAIDPHFGKNIQNVQLFSQMSLYSPLKKRQGTVLPAYQRFAQDLELVEKNKNGKVEKQIHNNSIPRKRMNFLIEVRDLVASSTPMQLQEDLTQITDVRNISRRQSSQENKGEWINMLANRKPAEKTILQQIPERSRMDLRP